MTTHLDSATSIEEPPVETRFSGGVKLAIVAGASALAAGLATAWWYRKTLNKLRAAETSFPDPDFRIPPCDEGDSG